MTRPKGSVVAQGEAGPHPDLVVLAAEWGHGRRRGWLSNLHLGALEPDGTFVMVGKTSKASPTSCSAGRPKHCSSAKSRRRGSWCSATRSLSSRSRSMACNLDRYAGGVALRFARVRRDRPDKGPAARRTPSTPCASSYLASELSADLVPDADPRELVVERSSLPRVPPPRVRAWDRTSTTLVAGTVGAAGTDVGHRGRDARSARSRCTGRGRSVIEMAETSGELRRTSIPRACWMLRTSLALSGVTSVITVLLPRPLVRCDRSGGRSPCRSRADRSARHRRRRRRGCRERHVGGDEHLAAPL